MDSLWGRGPRRSVLAARGGDGRRTRSARRAIALLGALLAIVVAPATASATEALPIAPAIDRAVAHLESAQLPDGSLGARLSTRDSTTAAEALRLARPGSPAIAKLDAYLSPLSLADVDSLARAALGSPAARHPGALLGNQNDDGGFGLSGSYRSDALDTALALRALTALDERDAARRALDRLLKLSSAGSWGNGDVALSGEALLALNSYVQRYGSSSALDSTLVAAVAWLGSAQHVDGSWSASPLSARETALAVAALAPTFTALDRVTSGARALLAAQESDGSWGDPFSTALAIRALHSANEAIERDRVTQLPDPSVRARDISASPTTVDSGKSITITAKVTNAGAAAAAGVTAEFFLDDPASGADPVATAEVPELAPGAQAPVEATFSVGDRRARVRSYVVLRAPVGQDRDLANNTGFINIFVRPARNSYPKTRDWPRPGRDIQRSGTTPNHLHPGVDPDPIWQTTADGGHIAAEGKVFYADNSDVKVVDAKTGALAWRADHSIYYGNDDRYRPPVYNRGYLFSARPGSMGAVAAKTGEYQYYGIGGWGGSVPTFQIDVIPQEHGQDPVFAYLAGYDWVNPDARHCTFVPYGDPTDSPWNDYLWPATPTVGRDAGIGSIRLSHVCDGEPFQFASDGPRAFFSSWGYLTSFNPATGKGANGEPFTPYFDVKLPNMARALSAPLVDSLGQIITAGWEGSPAPVTNPSQPSLTGKGRVVASDPTNGSTYWAYTTDTRLDGSPVEYKGTVIVTDRSGRVYALDQTTGALKWSWKPDGYVAPPAAQQGKSGQTLALAGRYLYVPHPDGHIYTLDATNGSLMSATMFSGRPYDLAINDTDNAIFVRTLDGKLGAFRTREIPTQCAPDAANPDPAPGDIDRVSFNPDGSQLTTNAGLEQPALSSNGRYVAFAREAAFPYNSQLHVRDLQSGATTALPIFDQVTPDLQRYWKHQPQLSADGRYLGFAAYLRNFRTGAEGNAIYVMDRETGALDPVLKNADGSAQFNNIWLDGMYAKATDRDAQAFSMSDDAQTIAFATPVNGIVAGDNDNLSDVFVVNRATGQRKLISLTSSGQNIPSQNLNVSLSADGRYVAFTSTASLTGTPIDTGNYDGQGPYVHRYDLATGELKAISVNSAGKFVSGNSPRLSGDGRLVSFSSLAPSLLPAALRVWPYWLGQSVDGYLWDAANGQTELISVTNSGGHSNVAQVIKPVISKDGGYVAYQNTGLLEKGVTAYTQPQIMARDRIAGNTEQVSHDRWGVSGLGNSVGAAVSGDGSKVAFVSTATDLAPGDTNNLRDVYVLDRNRSAVNAGSSNPVDGSGLCPGESGGDYSDLAVEAGDIEPAALEQGQSGRVDVTVRNGGAAPSEATTVRLYDGDADHGTLIGEQSLAPLAAGGDTTLTFSWDPITSAGAHTLTVVADPSRLVFEQNVANNEAGKGVDVVAPRLDLAVDPDKQSYGADETVDLAAHLTNGSAAGRDARLVVSIRDEDGEEVAEVHDGQVHVAPNGDAVVHDDWNTQNTTPGHYEVSARLLNAVGDELADATSSFEIEPEVDAGLALETDQLSYGADDAAAIAATVSNRSTNSSLAGARVKLSLKDPDGQPVDDWDLPAGDVPQGRSARLSQAKDLSGLDPGTYDLSAKLLAADGEELAQATADFELRSSADTGDGVRGSLTASPTDPYRFTTAAFHYTLTNDGSGDIPGATVRVRISELTADLSDGHTVKTLDDTRTITHAGPNTGSVSTTADMAENRDYQASLHLVLADGSERALDRTIIHVRPAPFAYGASFDTSPRNRVLVWACSPADEAAARTALGDTFATYVVDCSDQARFMRLLRSGDYNQFWFLGGHHPLERSVGDEVGARIMQGDGLLVAGGDSGADLFSNAGTLSPLGASFAGTVPPGTYALQFAAGSAFAGLDAQVTGSPAKVTTTQATAVGTTTWGPSNNRKTAITATYNQFGQGKAVYVGSAPSAFADRSRAAAVLGTAASVLLPPAGATRATGLARLELFAEGTAPGSPLELRTQLPAGVGVPQAPADATLANNLLTLPFAAAGPQRRTRAVWLKLPAAPSIATTSTAYYRGADGQMKPYGNPASAQLAIAENAQSARAAGLAALGQIGGAGANDATLQRIRNDVTSAIGATTDTTTLWNRLRGLVDDIGTLQKSRWTNTAPAVTALSRLVTYVEYEYYLAGGK